MKFLTSESGARMLCARFGVVVSLLALGACVDEEAPDKCREIGEKYCEKHVEYCDLATPQDACEDIYDGIATCDDAIYLEEPEREECLTAIDELDACPTALPAECSGVVILPPDDGEDDE